MSRKTKVGLIGAGMISNMAHMPGYANIPDLCEMVAVCDLIEERAQKASKQYGIPKVTTDYRDILNDPEIEAVSIMTPNIFHATPAIEALQAGKHVLCEKPLAMNGEQARAICQAEKESGKILQVALQYRFSSAGLFMRDFIKAGQMGDVQYARAQALRRRGVPGWGVFTNKEKQGGGPLIDIGVHILDLTLYMMGYPKPVVAMGNTWDTLAKNPKNENFWGDFDRKTFTVEDFAVGMIRFDNGAVVTLESSFMSNGEGDPMRTQLYGTEAGAIVDPSGETPVKIYKQVEGQYFDMTPAQLPNVDSPYHGEIKAFIEAVQGGKPSPVPGIQGFTLNAVFDALYKSAETGREVDIDLTV